MTTTLDWYGCATFKLKTAGLTVFLDAYIDRADGAAGTGLTADDIDQCDWIVIGHSHFDHLWGAERIVANTGATVIGNYETVRLLAEAGVPLERMICVGGGERVRLGEELFVSVYPSLHSCVWTGTHRSGSGDVCLGDLGVHWHDRNQRMKDLQDGLATSLGQAAIEHLLKASGAHSNRGDGGTLVFLFETPEGSLLFQDTSGHWSPLLREIHPDVAILAAAGRANVDGEPYQGTLAEFVADQAEMVGAPRLVLAHHDDWLPGFASFADLGPIRAALQARVPDVELLEMDYLAATAIF